MDIGKELEDCTLCPRLCHADRAAGQKGRCGTDGKIRGARAALHMWEEPCISGTRGSGAVFFSGCALRCVFCQNREISGGACGKELSPGRLSEIFLELQEKGAANINLVTAGHFLPQVAQALEKARKQALHIPVIYNTGGYERADSLRRLEGLVDVWLPDFKYMDSGLAARYSQAPDYPEAAKSALAEMVSQAGACIFDGEGYIQKGVIVRHLILPGHTRDSMEVLRYLYETYRNKIYISVMNQYTPPSRPLPWPELNRKVTKREYERVLNFAAELGIVQGYCQEGGMADESFIPAFDCEGL